MSPKLSGKRWNDWKVEPTADAKPIVTVGLTKHYGEVRALESLNLSVRPTSGTASILGLLNRRDLR